MVSAQNTQKVLHAYVRRNGTPHVTIDALSEFALRFGTRFAPQQPEFAPLIADNRIDNMRPGLEELEKTHAVQLERDDNDEISHVYYLAFYPAEIGRWYRKMQDDKDLPFPAEESLNITIPAELVRTVEVADNLMHFLQSPDEKPGQILLLRFPNTIRDVVTTVKLLRDEMLLFVMNRLRDYLRTGNNGSYMETKLRSVFSNREMLVHEIIETTQIHPEEAVKTVTAPNEFQFHFWTQLSSTVITEYKDKADKLESEHGFCQAAYLLGYYAVFHKRIDQDDRIREQTHLLLTDALQKPPFTFTVQDIYNLTDDRGVLLTKRVSREEMNRWLEEMLRRPSEGRISELVTINTPQQSGLMIHSAQYVPLLLRLVKAAAPVVRRELINEAFNVLLEELDATWIYDEPEFEKALSKRVQEEFHILVGLAHFQTLFLVIDGHELPEGQREAAMGLIDTTNKDMRSWSEILQISRLDVYREARLRLPFWMLIPIIHGLVRMFRRMFSTSGASRSTSTAPSRSNSPSPPQKDDSEKLRQARRKQFKESVELMQRAYLDSGETADQKLKKLRNQWNPLIDPMAAENLVEDVNALCRDTVRRLRLKQTLQVPDNARVEELAKRIAAHSAFERIRRRKAFETYLKLYMLTVIHRS